MKTKIKNWSLFIAGLFICFAVAAVSVLLEDLIPGGLLGASIIALFMGTIINSFFHRITYIISIKNAVNIKSYGMIRVYIATKLLLLFIDRFTSLRFHAFGYKVTNL